MTSKIGITGGMLALPYSGARQKRITGWDAIDYATAHNLTLDKYADPTEDARIGLTVEEAREIAGEDDGLIYLDLGTADYCACGHQSADHTKDELENLLKCGVEHCDCDHFHYQADAPAAELDAAEKWIAENPAIAYANEQSQVARDAAIAAG